MPMSPSLIYPVLLIYLKGVSQTFYGADPHNICPNNCGLSDLVPGMIRSLEDPEV